MRLLRPLCLAVLVCCLYAAAEETHLPSCRPADRSDLGGQGWTAASQDAGHGFRAARAGRPAALSLPVWWGQSLRPAEGSRYNIKITYRDTTTRPAVVSSLSGLNADGQSELHRIGGEGDGQWKTADVPASWDLLRRKSYQGDVAELSILAVGADLPIESVQVEPIAPGADERFYEQTRQWIARQQAERMKTASLGRAQTPVIPEAMAAQAIVPYARTYMADHFQNDAPQKGEAGATLKARMARNEYEPIAFCVYANGQDLRHVTYELSPLHGDAGRLDCQAQLRTAEYSVVAGGREGKYRTWPQRLWPMYPVDIAKGHSHLFWITLHTLGEASKPGIYRGTVRIKAEGSSAEVPVEVEVLPITLLTMQQAGLELGTCISGLISEQDLTALAQANHTGMDLWYAGAHPEMTIRDGKMDLDFTYLDEWMATARRLGMMHMMWFFGGDPYGFPDTMTLERALYMAQGENSPQRQALRRVFIADIAKDPTRVPDRVRGLYVELVRAICTHGRENNWPTLILHPFDEPAKWTHKHTFPNELNLLGSGPWIKDHFKDCAALIREASVHALVGGDIHAVNGGLDFVHDVDVFCTNAVHLDWELGDKVRQAGTHFWQYAGTNDQVPAHRGRFNFGFYFAAFDSRGSLVWAYNSHNRFDTSDGNQWGYGWYTPFGTISGPFLEGLREAWDDRRYIETYRRLAGQNDSQAQALLAKIGQEAIKARQNAGNDTVNDFYSQMQSYEQMDQWREEIIQAILKLQQTPRPASQAASQP